MKTHKLQRKQYSTLLSVQKEILESGIEKVLEFNGYELITNRGKYGLYGGEVTFTKKTKKGK